MDRQRAIAELQSRFSDIVNYAADDPSTPVDPVTFRTPEGDTCLHLACVRGDLRAVELLIGLDVDVNAVGDLGNTPLHFAKAYGHDEIAEILVSHGSDVTRANEFGATP